MYFFGLFNERDKTRQGNLRINNSKTYRAQPFCAWPLVLALLKGLQQPLFHLLLAGNAVLGPGYRFKPFLLHFLLTIRANPVLIGLDTL